MTVNDSEDFAVVTMSCNEVGLARLGSDHAGLVGFAMIRCSLHMFCADHFLRPSQRVCHRFVLILQCLFYGLRCQKLRYTEMMSNLELSKTRVPM